MIDSAFNQTGISSTESQWQTYVSISHDINKAHQADVGQITSSLFRMRFAKSATITNDNNVGVTAISTLSGH